MERRPHATYMLYELRRFRVLLIVPLTRLLVELFRGETPALRRYETALAGLLVGYIVAKWLACRYHLAASKSGRFHTVGVRQGLFLRRSLHIAAEEAASVEIERTPLLWLFGGRRIRVNTAGLRRRSDVQLYLSAAQTRALFATGNGTRRYRAARWPVLVMSLTGSNAAVGLLTVAPLLNRAGRLLGNAVTPDVVGLVDRFISTGLPPTLRLAANVLVVGWAVAALRSFCRYVGFSAQREAGYLQLVSGLFTRRDVLIDCNKITTLELRQTLTMRLFSLYTAVITAAGYGRDIGTRPVLIPAAPARELAHGLDRLLPEYPLCSSLLRPVRGAWKRYTAAPVLWLMAGVGLWFLGAWWRTVAIIWTGFGLWWLLVRLLGLRQAGFGCTREAIALCYPRGLAFYHVYLPDEVLDSITITQSYFQRHRGSCTVRVRCFGEKKRTHRLWGLPYDAVRHMITT